MSNQFAVIGGDLRIIELVKILAKENNIVYTYGLEKAEQLKNLDKYVSALIIRLVRKKY